MLIDKDENIISLNSNVISKFIKACQNQPFDLFSSELQAFYYLSLKFEVINLINYIKSQLSSNNPQFLLQLLSLKLKCKDFYEKEEQVNEEMKTFYSLDTCEEEEIISKEFERLTSDDNLIQLPLPILYRIFEGYLRQRRDKNPIEGKTRTTTKTNEGDNEELQFTKSEENNIEVFLFKCLDYHGRSASTLFSFINFEHIRSEVIERLITQYRNTFDFTYINGTLMKTISDLTSQQVLLIEVNKRQQQQISQLIEENSSYKNEIHELQQQFEQFKKDIEQKHSQEISSLQNLIQNNTDNIKAFNVRYQTEFGSIKSVQKQLIDLSNSNQNKINSIQNDISSKLANQNNVEVDIPNTFSIPKLNDDSSDGICRFLLYNICDWSNSLPTIEIKGFPDINNNEASLNNLVAQNNSNAWCSKNTPDAYIQFDFGKSSIAFAAIRIWTGDDPPNGRHIQSLKILGSNNGKTFASIEQWYNIPLNSKNAGINCVFASDKSVFYRYLKLQLNGPNYKKTNELYLKRIEFFGNVRRDPTFE